MAAAQHSSNDRLGSRLTATGPESQTIKTGVNTAGQVRLKQATWKTVSSEQHFADTMSC